MMHGWAGHVSGVSHAIGLGTCLSGAGPRGSRRAGPSPPLVLLAKQHFWHALVAALLGEQHADTGDANRDAVSVELRLPAQQTDATLPKQLLQEQRDAR
jgi:hypothetical protein